ncbi:DNA replication/repair protein RecF [Peredibacter sp. HCB2-198]|uniref:DNA replication/repair protein RecF n=1 Tax=Peredibacter sp. HCB2-198 TaxID=3383025 RepID=UPI0038B53FCC
MNCWKIKKLQAQNFRNLKNSIFDFSPGINCILGQNGNGKTNLLEAVFLLTNKKSFRKNTDYAQMINIEGESPEIILQSVFESEDGLLPYSLRMSDSLEERFFNNKPEKSKTPSTSVFINPFDSYNFHTSGTFRRQWVDSHISLGDKEYRQVLTRFQKAMKFRNSVLGFGGKNASMQLRAIDEQVSEYSAFITQRRFEFLTALNQFITPTFKAIFSEEHTLQLDLDSLFVHWDQKRIFDFYRHQENADLKAEVTQVGVHRDDFIFSFDGLNAFEFCSLGQQKMAFLSLIFAYIELFRYKFTSYPIVLIDDVSGELDSQRWKNLIQYLETKNFQVLITTANESFGKELEKIPASKKFYMEHGTLKHHG